MVEQTSSQLCRFCVSGHDVCKPQNSAQKSDMGRAQCFALYESARQLSGPNALRMAWRALAVGRVMALSVIGCRNFLLPATRRQSLEGPPVQCGTEFER